MSEEKLMPCPNPWCCPSDQLLPAVIWVHSEALVQCESCGMQGPGINPVVHDDDGEVIGTRDAEADAITAWNTRHPTPVADEVEDVDAWEIVRQIASMEGRTNAQTYWFGKARDLMKRKHAAIAALQARSAEPAGDVEEAFLRLCEEIGIPATAGAYLEYRIRKAEPAGDWEATHRYGIARRALGKDEA